LVIKRFLAVLFPAHEYEQVTVQTVISGEKFIAKGKVVINAGWKEVYENRFDDEELTDDIKDQLLPNIEKGGCFKDQVSLSHIRSNKATCTFYRSYFIVCHGKPYEVYANE